MTIIYQTKDTPPMEMTGEHRSHINVGCHNVKNAIVVRQGHFGGSCGSVVNIHFGICVCTVVNDPEKKIQ